MTLSDRAKEDWQFVEVAAAGARASETLRLIGVGHAPQALPRSREIAEPLPSPRRNRIFVRRLQMAARIGVYEWEKLDMQPIVIDLEFDLPSELPCHSDKVADAIDYAEVVAALRHLATARHYELVEAMAEAMAGCVQRDFGVPWVKLTLSKLAPFPGAEVGIVVERGRPG